MTNEITRNPGMAGSSRTSLFAMRQMHTFFSPRFEFVPQSVGQIPWGRVRMLLAKVKTVEAALLYADACVERGWSHIRGMAEEKRLHKGGVGPGMRSPAGLEPTPQRETPLSGRRAGDAISGGVSTAHCITFAPHGKRLEARR